MNPNRSEYVDPHPPGDGPHQEIGPTEAKEPEHGDNGEDDEDVHRTLPPPPELRRGSPKRLRREGGRGHLMGGNRPENRRSQLRALSAGWLQAAPRQARRLGPEPPLAGAGVPPGAAAPLL